MFRNKIFLAVIFSILIVLFGMRSEIYGDDGDNNFKQIFTDSPSDMLDSNTRDVVAGSDLDQDGIYEIIVTDYDNGGQVHVFEVIGDNTIAWVWSSPGTNSLNPFAAREVKTGDLDNDGIGEILMSISANDVSADSSGIYVYEWDGVNDNSYIPMGIITIDLGVTEGYTEDFIVEDIDSDGVTEAVFLNSGPDEVDNCYIISVSGTFETTWSQVTEATFTRLGGDFNGNPYDVAVGDLDGDTFKEVIVSITEDAGALFIVESSAPNTYVASAYVHVDTSGNDGYSLEAMATADFNGDGADELFVALYPSRQVAVVTGGTDVSTIAFEDNVRIIRSEGQGIFGMAIGDQDHGPGSDGPDIYLSDYGNSEAGGYIQNFEFTGTDIFDPSSYTEHVIFQDTEISSPIGLFQLDAPAVDLDGDGNMELLLTYTGTDLPEDVYLRVFEFDTNTPTLTLTSPSGGEDWAYGSVQNITWTSENFIGGMRIEYSPDNGSNWNEIISYTANDGNYDWSIPNDPSTSSLVRISKIADGPPTDESDAPFTISTEMAQITFVIDDSQFQELTDCQLMGSWNSAGEYDLDWSSGEHQMYDNGTNGDLVAGDHLWSVQLDLVVDNGAETWEWGALDGPDGSWLIEGPNQQFTLPDNSPQTLTYIREGFSTPCTGVSWTLDDLVTNSGGIITGSYPNYVTQNTIVICASDELTIAAGSRLEFVKGELRIFGTLNVRGESGNMVTFSSNSGTPAADDWGTLHFKPGSDGTIEYANVEYSHNGLWCDSGSPSIVTNSSFNNISNDGIYFKNITSGVFDYNVISNCGWNGASLENSSIQFTNNSISIVNTGIRVSDVSSADIDSNIVNNSVYDGIALYNSSPNIRYNLIYNNNDEGIDCSESSPNIINNTIDNNGLNPAPVGYPSAGIECGESSAPVIKNNIITNNSNFGINCFGDSYPVISYNNVWGYTDTGYEGCSAGIGGFDEDPVYANSDSADYTLQCTSPCIDSGDPASPLDLDGTEIEMGAYYFDQSSFQVISPNGEELWDAGTTHDITWNPLCSVDSMKIEYSTDAGSNWIVIHANTANDGAESWKIPNTPTVNCLVRIADINGSPSDESDAVFSILGQTGIIWQTILKVSDENGSSAELTFGTGTDATDGFDAAYDQYAPPPPPAGNFDCRLIIDSESYYKDFRGPMADDPDSEIIWLASFQYSEDGEPITLNWDSSSLPASGFVRLVDNINGGFVDIDMKSQDSLIVPSVITELQIIFKLSTTFDMTMIEGWNMIGLPLEPEDNHYLNLFPNAMENTLYKWRGSYIDTTHLDAGLGYWLRMPSAETVGMEGTDITSVSINMMEGWNMISGISENVELNSVEDPGGILVSGTLYEFNGIYDPSDSVKQGKGYWLRANADGQITIAAGTGSGNALAKNNLALGLENYPRLQITDAKGFARDLYLNIEVEALEDKLSYELPPIPPSGAFDVRFSDGLWINENDEGTINLQSNAYPVTVSLIGLTADEGYQYVLKEMINNKENETYVFAKEGSRQITNILVNILVLTKEKIIPREFAVFQNYPNPFNPTTEIKYGIPEDSEVDITIYNALGQRIKTLIKQQQKAGYHQVTWDGTNFLQQKVSTGIYFYGIKAGKNFEIKKMLMMK